MGLAASIVAAAAGLLAVGAATVFEGPDPAPPAPPAALEAHAGADPTASSPTALPDFDAAVPQIHPPATADTSGLPDVEPRGDAVPDLFPTNARVERAPTPPAAAKAAAPANPRPDAVLMALARRGAGALPSVPGSARPPTGVDALPELPESSSPERIQAVADALRRAAQTLPQATQDVGSRQLAPFGTGVFSGGRTSFPELEALDLAAPAVQGAFESARSALESAKETLQLVFRSIPR